MTLPPPPPSNTSATKVNSDERELLLYTVNVNKFLKNRFQEVQEFLDATQAVMQTSTYKNNNRFRNDKAFKGQKMVMRTLQRLKDLNLKEVLKRFSDLIPLAVDIKNTDRDLYLPMDSVLHHWLCNIKQAFDLSERLLGLCEHTVKYLLARIRLGHFWNWAVFSYANISRIWTLSQTMVLYLHLGYDVYKQLLECLPKSEVQWLPETIQIENELLHPDSQLREKETMKKLFLNNDFPVGKSELNSTNSLGACIGEIVERPVVVPENGVKPEASAKLSNKKFLQRLNSALSEIRDLEGMKIFIKTETDQRHKCRKDALTKKLEQSEWKALKTQIKSKMKEGAKLSSLRALIVAYFSKDSNTKARNT